MAKAPETTVKPGPLAVQAEQGGSVVSWQDELKNLAVATAEAEKPSGNWFSFKAGILALGGEPLPNSKAKVVVLHAVFENQWYKSKYDPNVSTTPHCFAFGEDDENLAPHPDSAEPQALTCKECPKNAWKSDPEGGKGKACKNVRRLACISANDLNIVGKADIAMAKIPVTSVGNWSSYASQLASMMKRPPLAFITEISCKPSTKTILEVNFELVDKVPEEAIPELLARRRDTTALVYAPYDKPTEAQPQQSRKF